MKSLVAKVDNVATDDLKSRSLDDLERELAILEGRPVPTEVEGVTVTGKKAPKKPKGALESISTAIGNVPRSAVELVKGTVEPLLNPIQTVKTVGALGAGTAARAMQALTGVEDITWRGKTIDTGTADAAWQYLVDRYGGADNLRNTFEQDPVGLLADASMILTGGGAAAARAPGMVGRAARTVESVGRKIDPLAVGVKGIEGAGKLAGRAAVGTLAVTTGKGSRAFTEAAKAGYEGGNKAQAFKEHLTGARGTDDILEGAKGAVEKMYAERGAEYKAGMGTVNADPTVLDFQPVKDAIKAVEGLAYTKGQSGTASAVTVNPAAARVFKDVNKVVNSWAKLDPTEFHTPGQLDKLKQNIGILRDSYDYGTPAYKAANDVYAVVRKQIADQAPGYAPVMEAYEKATRVTKDLQKSLSLGDNSATTAAVGKLERMLNPSNKRLGEMGSLLEKYAPEELAPSIAGETLSTVVPTGMRAMGKAAILGFGGLTNPLLFGAIPFMSPRVAGSAAFRAGTAARPVGEALSAAGDVYDTSAGRVGALGLSRVGAAVGEEVAPEEVAPVEEVVPEEPVVEDVAPNEGVDDEDLSNLTLEELEAELQELEQAQDEDEMSSDQGAQEIIGSLGEDEALALTALGEASPNPAEQRAVIHTVLNRQKAGGFGNSLPEILRPDQFNAWENAAELAAKRDTPQFQRVLEIVRQVKAGELPDNTGGAVYFFAPETQKILHRQNPKKYRSAVPSWAQGKEGRQIGATRFFSGV